jgi:hypothetical protein
METRGKPSDQIVSELLELAANLTPEQIDKPGTIVVIRFDREGNELGEQCITKAQLAKHFQESMVVGAKNGKFKVLV